MQLLRDQIVLRPDDDDAEQKTSSGIILTAPQQNPFATGLVVQVGQYSVRPEAQYSWRPNKYSTSSDNVNVGDRVLYRRYQVEDFDVDGGETGLKLTNENAIVGILEDE
jgi:co-chaperonin GroES (HSP10)